MFSIQPGDTLLILGDEDTGLVISRPEVLSTIADKILDSMGQEEQ